MLDKFINLLLYPFTYMLSSLIPKKNIIVFGEWSGDRIGDNSYYLLMFLLDTDIVDDYKLVLITKNINEHTQFLESKGASLLQYGSFSSFLMILRSKYGFITHSYRDLHPFYLLHKTKVFQLWHGSGIKNIGRLENNNRFYEKLKQFHLDKLYLVLSEKMISYDAFLSSSEKNFERNLRAFSNKGATKHNILKIGQPRVDYLLKNKDESGLYKEKFGINPEAIVVTYLPTYKNNAQNNFSFFNLDSNSKTIFDDFLKKNRLTLLEKQHSFVFDEKQNMETHEGVSMRKLDSKTNTQELLLATDILITDFSSCYIDFLVLDRPIIHFMPRGEKYHMEEQGIYYDMKDIQCGPFIYDLEELIFNLEMYLNTGFFSQQYEINNDLAEYEKGISSQVIYQYLKKR